MKVVFLYLSLGALLSETRGDELTISPSFKNCDVLFSWNNLQKKYYDVRINNTPWARVFEPKYTVKDALMYNDNIRINVRAEHSSKDNTLTYNVSTVESKTGANLTISWSVSFFPRQGIFDIFHMKNNESTQIISVSTNNSPKITKPKYRYLSQPYNSTCISFGIIGITLDDAGYYAGGTDASNALSSGRGVFLKVSGHPTKPNIRGNLNVSVGSYFELTCLSKSTSAPDYYARLEKLSYMWLVNGTKMDNKNNQKLSLHVTKDIRYNKYSCTAMGKKLESEPSDTVKINPLYKPDKLSIDPKPKLKNGTLTVKEGETIGPYDCSADCNPPCEIIWKYKDTAGTLHDATFSGYTLSVLTVSRNISLLRCIAKYMDERDNKRKHNIFFDVQYLDNPVLFVSDTFEEPNHTVKIKEGKEFQISCNVNGNPEPKMTLRKVASDSKINQSTSGDWLNHTMKSLQCSDIGTYKCTGMSPGFNNTEKMFRINVTCDTRLDYSLPMKTLYGSKSGQDIKVTVAVPVIANPPPQKSSVTWFGPVENLGIASTVSQQDVPYKHRINSSIPILNQNYFGNYTLKYNMTDVVTITINAEDVPQVPRNFTGYSYASGYINLTWVSGFDGGKEQHFILSIRDRFGWQELANLSDPGQGRVVHYASGRLNAGQEYWYQLKSCNIINCSKESANITITAKAEPRLSVLLDKTFVIGASCAVVILILTIVFVLIILKRKTVLNRQDNQQDGAEIADQPDVVLYAAVDKSAFQKNQNKADVVAEAVPEKKDETDNLYAVVEKKTTTEAKPSATKPESEQKNESKRERQEGATAAEATGASGTSRNVNQDGLIYIDVDFAKKPENKDKNEKPKIHGEEDRTVVDFSKKAPVVKKKPKKEEEK
uniref:Uncharacterized protein LOC111111531 isoform X2 n=1 Tax=Crassostrea virginica TaxID=6565 RepID=A0A8B8BLS3_CRAVI|nr:uncharacterized protein LOC111111531 isoform X2 [Crassostrea virginica]